ncbi:Peptidoglycan/LPS O-acetylase OafA/YrhL, contains acyltransferase and SGNH-hydrolase domains [Geodermatophilus telluris]|uniref:Peptidoglycan/LPS O-acetylase OafA/YrhL, contains acyltransferase and SGNH-hydrolase domains n=1 Tax=Geodermatophilus telluris TaxID=1190417 RepID=A0A1G6IGQ8_9ACTN|nr:acyltransferase family protein [Geodermatophilus telluris]SDC05737.1 Peptidoglycan/LPS O-acetylase OafA/YrhL, contains acyltransferase and SGNH-hydrolase domains [Geodermatophilus telluris]
MLSLRAPEAPATPRERTFLPEVQALRALAVLLVVVYHLWPNRLTGGYVGVDVFFVISGFLITSHLRREVERTGTLSLRAFYARRARRLLPAALLVLLVTALASGLLLPVSRWAATAGDVLASTFYVQNWALAGRAVDYSASQDAASVVQHYWSLSVEEQFYAGWPLLVLALVWLAGRTRSGRPLLLPGIAVVTAASLAWSVYWTATEPAAAYFQTPTRVWELGVGAVLALGLSGARAQALLASGPMVPVVLRWAGFAAIAVAAVTLSSASPFPGYLALLPVLGTAAVIAAGDTGPRDPSSRLVSLAPTQFVGDVSYAVYLWHWPLIVLAPFALARPLTTVDKLAVLAASLLLAWGTRQLVEQPAQQWRRLRRPLVVGVCTVVAMALVSGVAAWQYHRVDVAQAAARDELAAAQEDPCFGAGSLAPGATGCGDVFGPPASLVLPEDDAPWFRDPACRPTRGGPSDTDLGVKTCRFGTDAPTRRVALVGDSHAEHWRGAVHEIARQQGWELVEIFRGACPVTEARVLAFQGDGTDTEGCARWGGQVTDWLTSHDVDAVVTTSFTTAFTFAGEDSLEAGAQGFAATWTAWLDAGLEVDVLRDVPTTGLPHVPECLQAHPDDPRECSRPRDEAVVPDAATLAAERIAAPGLHLVDLTDYFCDETTCYTAIGGAVVYFDANHLTAQYSRSLAPFLFEELV